MREFETEYKINFIDKNDVLVGFDSYQSCCENFGWFYSFEPLLKQLNELPNEPNPPSDLEEYVFNPGYIKESEGDYDTYAVTFELLNGENKLYLTLYNSHNGYYSHGFSLQAGDKVIKASSL